jgi:hypothetical protein
MERIYVNFERYAEEMLLQAAGIHPVPWEQAPNAFLKIIEHQDLDWWLTGSMALCVRGIDIKPRDFDFVFDGEGDQRLGDLLLQYLYEPVMPVEDWTSNWFGRAFLHARIEWVSDVNDSIEQYGPSDADPTAAKLLEMVSWRGNEILVPPLDLGLAVSERRGLTERVEKIIDFMNKHV